RRCATAADSPFSASRAPPSLARRPKMENRQLFSFQRLGVYRVALQFAQLVHGAPIIDAELRNQARRSAKSAFLQLCEGLPNYGEGLRRKYFTESSNSLHETVGNIDLACVIGALPAEHAALLQRVAFQFKRLLGGLQ